MWDGMVNNVCMNAVSYFEYDYLNKETYIISLPLHYLILPLRYISMGYTAIFFSLNELYILQLVSG